MFHICTIFNDAAACEELVGSLRLAGFNEANSQFELLDNTAGNLHDPFETLNRVVSTSVHPYLLFCHQDVRLNQADGYQQLAERLQELTLRAPRWAVAGNAGTDASGLSIMRITEPNGAFASPDLPKQVYSLDENFLVIRTETGLKPSPGLSGFHLYATDLCFNAMRLGYSCHVIDFHLTHLSSGNTQSAAYAEAMTRFCQQWNPRLACAIVNLVTSNSLRLSRYPWVRWLIQRHRVSAFARRRGLVFIPIQPGRPLSRFRALAGVGRGVAFSVMDAARDRLAVGLGMRAETT